MKISIILSTYNGSVYLKDQLNSIITQSVSPYELIIVDDNSSDNGETCKIINEYKSKYKFIKFYKNKSNEGWAESFMNSTKYATGDIILFCDQDDIWQKNKIEIINQIFKQKNINVLLHNVENFEYSKLPSCLICEDAIQIKELTNLPFNFYFSSPKGEGCCLAIRTSFLLKYRNLWESGYSHDAFVQLLSIVFDKLYYLDNILTYRRIHNSNASHTWGKHGYKYVKNLKAEMKIIKNILNKYSKVIDTYKNQIMRKYLEFIIIRIIVLNKLSILKWMKYFHFAFCYKPQSYYIWKHYLKFIVKHKFI